MAPGMDFLRFRRHLQLRNRSNSGIYANGYRSLDEFKAEPEPLGPARMAPKQCARQLCVSMVRKGDYVAAPGYRPPPRPLAVPVTGVPTCRDLPRQG